ncbi:sporulation inhibitor of replication protein SirA [Bacillus solimangrovi]|uniref:Sporulation inhibitor of replication protein SirA n=1 Tax=Bacillus solimangrovi TaxID=1305675 RepID=A0A1E5LJ04_9BACI|nr:sporulation inhibitor of replication protein SirA [Bacillus solimangrovi]OEH94067.1 hypothetical protein BFG57_09470 [Bacillus solimangrovi]
MRHYSIYLLSEDVANDYFGKEPLLYQLFSDYERTKMVESELLQRQVDYITLPVSVVELNYKLQKELKRYRGNSYSYDSHVHSLTLRRAGGTSQAQLSLFSSFIILNAKGSYEAETIFFEILRKYKSTFLAMDFDSERFGWLNPIKQQNFI